MIAFVVIFVSEQERCRCYGIQTSLITSVFEKWRELNLTPFKLYCIFNFCTFFKKIGKLVLIFSLGILRVILHKTIVHALVLILHMKPFHIAIHCFFLPCYCGSTQRGTSPLTSGLILPHVPELWFLFCFVHICKQMTQFLFSNVLIRKYLVKHVTESS